MSIHTITDKIKRRAGERGIEWHTLATGFLIVLVALVSFYLGYAARADIAQASPVVIQCPVSAYIEAPQATEGASGAQGTSIVGPGEYLASKNGTRYYPKDCASASRIKAENRVWFQTMSEAEARGLTLAAGCE